MIDKVVILFASCVELPTADKVWQVLFAFLVKMWNSRFSLSNLKTSAVMPSAMTSRSENLGTTPHRGTFPSLLTRFPAKSLHIPRILIKFAVKFCISEVITVNGCRYYYLLNISNMRNFSFTNI